MLECFDEGTFRISVKDLLTGEYEGKVNAGQSDMW